MKAQKLHMLRVILNRRKRDKSITVMLDLKLDYKAIMIKIE